MELTAKITAAAEHLKTHVALQPTIGLVLGSGLGDYADTLEDCVRIPFADIPNFPLPTIEGHAGALVFGRKHGKRHKERSFKSSRSNEKGSDARNQRRKAESSE